MTPNFDEILIHCSSLGKLLTNPKSKADIEQNNLSATAKTHLIEVYAKELYDFRKELNNKYIAKGNEVEQDGIDTLSLQLRYPMEKNEEIFSNDFFVGTPDVITQNMVFDVKSSYDWITFLSNIPSELDPMYVAQVNSYLDLLGYDTGYIAYVLLDTPESIRNKAKALTRKFNLKDSYLKLDYSHVSCLQEDLQTKEAVEKTKTDRLLSLYNIGAISLGTLKTELGYITETKDFKKYYNETAI